MQRVKSRVKSRPLHEEEEEEEEGADLPLFEDVNSESESTTSLQPLLPPATTMVTIANEQVADPIRYNDPGPGVSTIDCPESLVFVNKGEPGVIEDVSSMGDTTPLMEAAAVEVSWPAAVNETVETSEEEVKEEAVVVNGTEKDEEEVREVRSETMIEDVEEGMEMRSLVREKTPVVEEPPAKQAETELKESTPVSSELQENEEKEEEQVEPKEQEEEEEVLESTPIPSEVEEEERAEPSPISSEEGEQEEREGGYRTLPEKGGPVYDEYGNELDEKGHPIIHHAFPEGWVLQPEEQEGIMVFETEDGPVRFIMNLTEGGFDFPDPPNEMRLNMDIYHKNIPTTHRIASGCEFFVDNGIWRIELETEIVNALLRMDIAKVFEFATGETLWNDSKDITIENLTRAMIIFKDCTKDETPSRWLLAQDSHYNPKEATYRLQLETEIENRTEKVSIHDGMDLVKTETRVSIPQIHDTEVRNVRNFIIYEDSELLEQGKRHLDSGGYELVESAKDFRLVEDSVLEDQGTRHLLSEGGVFEDQGKRHLISEGVGEVDDIVRGHVIAEDLDLEDIARGFEIVEECERVNISRHDGLVMDQSIERPPARWGRSKFEGVLVDMKDWRLVNTDIKLVVSPSKFKLNQIEIDEGDLEEIGGDEEEA